MEQRKSFADRKAVLVVSVFAVLFNILRISDVNGNKHDVFYKNGAVATEAKVCSDIGVEVLKENGTAMDAAIASMFCLGLINPQSSGIGGGGFMLVYKCCTTKPKFLDFRETAPAASTVDMFVNKTHLENKQGKLSVAVPGEVLGMYNAWKMYGKLPWKRLIEPTIGLASNGYTIEKALSAVLRKSKTFLMKERGFREVYYHKDGSPRKQGETVTDPIFAKTLTEISINPLSFYNGSISKEIVKDIQERGGILTEEDLRNYTVKEREVLVSSMTSDDKLYTSSAPSSGSTMIMILNILKGFNFSQDALFNHNIVRTWHRILEAFKFAFALFPSLGDPDFDTSVEERMKLQMNSTYADKLRQNIWDNVTHDSLYYGGFCGKVRDHGTTHLSVLSPSGDAVSVTTTVGRYFGAKIRSYKTGIVYNSHMSTFSIPTASNDCQSKLSKANYLAPGKRPLSSVCPTIVVDKNGLVRMVVGGSGNNKIVTEVSLVLMNKLWFGLSLKDSIIIPRLHHDLYPNLFTFETEKKYRMKQSVIDGLQVLGHKSNGQSHDYCAVQGIFRDSTGHIYAASDPRKNGVAAGF